MKSKNTTAQQNTTVQQNTTAQQNAIANFFKCYGDSTQKEFSSFLFDMLGCFTETRATAGEQYTEDCLLHFQMLHELVNELQPVKK